MKRQNVSKTVQKKTTGHPHVRFVSGFPISELRIRADMSGHVRFLHVPIIYRLKTALHGFFENNAKKGLMNVIFCKDERFGSFLEIVLGCGNQLRAMSDFFVRKSMSGRGETGPKAGRNMKGL